MKRLTMLAVFLAIGAVVGGGYWYWQHAANGAEPASQKGKAKGKGKGKGGGGALVVKASRAVIKPMPVLIEAVGTQRAGPRPGFRRAAIRNVQGRRQGQGRAVAVSDRSPHIRSVA
jgi:hypothetical protein